MIWKQTYEQFSEKKHGNNTDTEDTKNSYFIIFFLQYKVKDNDSEDDKLYVREKCEQIVTIVHFSDPIIKNKNYVLIKYVDI